MGRESQNVDSGARAGLLPLAFRERLDSRRTNLVRVLAYERIERAAPFERQMEHLAARHPVVSPAQVLDTFEGGHALAPRAVLLVFRDARDFAAVVWPILERHDFAAVLCVSSARALAGEVRALVHRGVALGVSPLAWKRAEHDARAAFFGDLRREWAALERERFDSPRVYAYADGGMDEGEVEAVRAAGAELAITALPGTNDLRQIDPLRLRAIRVDGNASLDAFRARLAPGSSRANPVTPEERRFLRAARARRTRLCCVHRLQDALLTAGERPRPPLSSALGALLGSSNYERLRNAVCLATVLAPALERRLRRALLDTTHLPLFVTGVELVGHGSAATVFRLLGEPGQAPRVLKVYRWTLGQAPALLLQMARRHHARYQELRRWLGDAVLPAHFLVLHGPLHALPVAACLQEWVGGSKDLLALSDEELLRLLRSRAELGAEFVVFARRALELAAQGCFPDLLGPGNLLLVEHGGAARIRLIDYGLFRPRLRDGGQIAAAPRACVRRLEELLRALEPAPPGA